LSKRFLDALQTTIWDGASFVPPIVGLDEENGDFAEWLDREYHEGADIEIGYTWSGGRHVVMIAKVYDSNGNPFVKFREDEVAGDDTQGDEFAYAAPIRKGANGKYRFLTNEMTIAFAVSERVKR
jgi:hypothetical protein